MGYVKPNPGTAACTLCPAGTASLQGSASCTSGCNPGYSGDPVNGIPCTACRAGTYQESTDYNAVCLSCPVDTHTAGTGTTTRDGCLCNEGYTGTVGACTLCAVGTYKSVLGSSACVACAIGHFSTVLGAAACIPCAAGKYKVNPGPGNETCTQCPIGTFVAKEGAFACQGSGCGVWGTYDAYVWENTT
jgi:hypothetical protein